MIVDKKIIQAIDAPTDAGENPMLPDDDHTTLEEVRDNPLIEAYSAVKRVLESMHTDPADTQSPKLFQTVKIDNGQFQRIVRSHGNTEYAVRFPAVFIHFINVRFLVAQQRIGEGRATMRIRFILNTLNNSDDVAEVEGFKIFQQINDAIQDAKGREAALNERCNLTYFDMPESQDNGLQSFWIDYEIWFRTSSSFQYRNWVDRYLVMPPFTNHSDAMEHDTESHGDHPTPTIEEVAKFEPSVDVPPEQSMGKSEDLPPTDTTI